MPRTYRISMQPPLQENLYCLELYASYLHSLAAVAATIGLDVLSGTLCRILTGLWCCHGYSSSCVVWGIILFMCHTYKASGHYAFYASYLQSFCAAAAASVVVVV